MTSFVTVDRHRGEHKCFWKWSHSVPPALSADTAYQQLQLATQMVPYKTQLNVVQQVSGATKQQLTRLHGSLWPIT